MNRLAHEFEMQDQVPGDTPLRAYQPRFRRTEALDSDAHSVIPRKWFLSRSERHAVSDSPEQCANVKPRLLQKHFAQKQIYQGDRFIPRRYGCNYEMANYLLKKKEPDNMKKYEIDIRKQVDSLDTMFRREGIQAMMLKHNVISGFNQERILNFSNSTKQLSNSNSFETKSNGKWKCISRKKTLIKSPEQILCMSNGETNEENLSCLIDWSCNNMIVIIHHNCVKIYENDGSVVAVLMGDNGKWSNDGSKLAVSEYDSYTLSSRLMLFEVEKKKTLWVVVCKCFDASLTEDFRSLQCICWSLQDRHVVVACENEILVHASNSGKLLRSVCNDAYEILILTFSPNFKHLMSASKNGTIRVYFWPELTIHFLIWCDNHVQAIAWHPQVPDLVCLGKSNGILTLWNVNTKTRVGYIRPKLNGCVENLAWNKLSGELLVHWTYKEGGKRYTIVPVLASFDRAVDVVPIDRETKISFMKFSFTHEEIITFSDDFFSIWNFFGNENPPQRRHLPLYSSRQSRQGVIIHNQIR